MTVIRLAVHRVTDSSYYLFIRVYRFLDVCFSPIEHDINTIRESKIQDSSSHSGASSRKIKVARIMQSIDNHRVNHRITYQINPLDKRRGYYRVE